MHTRTLDELFLTKKLLQKYQIAFCASLMFNIICAKKLKQQHDVLDCSTYPLNVMKLKDALRRVLMRKTHNALGDLLNSSAGPKVDEMRACSQFDPATDKIYK